MNFLQEELKQNLIQWLKNEENPQVIHNALAVFLDSKVKAFYELQPLLNKDQLDILKNEYLYK